LSPGCYRETAGASKESRFGEPVGRQKTGSEGVHGWWGTDCGPGGPVAQGGSGAFSEWGSTRGHEGKRRVKRASRYRAFQQVRRKSAGNNSKHRNRRGSQYGVNHQTRRGNLMGERCEGAHYEGDLTRFNCPITR